MTRADLQKACGLFAIKIAIYWIAKLVICQLDPSRLICSVIAKGFVPCLATFALTDFVVIPQLRAYLRRRRNDQGDNRADRLEPGGECWSSCR